MAFASPSVGRRFAPPLITAEHFIDLGAEIGDESYQSASRAARRAHESGEREKHPHKLDGPLANRDAWRATRCSVDLALTVVGTRSAMLLLREAFYGTTRFHDFAQRVGITDAAAAGRLKELADVGVFEKRPYRDDGQRTRREYHLTDMGQALLPAVLALMQWGDTYLQDDGGPLRVVQDDTGAPVHVRVCARDGSEVPLDGLRVRPARRTRRRTNATPS